MLLRLTRPALILALLLVTTSFALAARVERLIDTWRPEHYVVNITLNDQLTEIASATAHIRLLVLKRTNLIDLDFGELKTNRVTLNSSPVPFTHSNNKLLVTLPEIANPGTRLELVVTYQGKPKDGLILTNDKDGKPSAVGDNWPNRVHHWIPTLDHPSAKATVTFNITAAAREAVVANGRLNGVETTATGQRTWAFSEASPIPPYCMIIAVGQFARLEPPESRVTPLSYYVPHSDREFALKGFAPAIPSLEFFNQLIAPYPYEKLALIVGATRFGGMENSSAIVFTSNLFNPSSSAVLSRTYGIPSGTVRLIAHEVAHQWFGDSVTGSTWSDLWLSEGFATYFAGLFVQRFEGEEAFQSYMKDAAASVLAYEKEARPPIFDRETEDLFKLLNANNYQKGAWVLHMLRMRLGDDAFFRGIRNYYEAHKNSIASTEDLRSALEKASGTDLGAFFKRWVYESGHPRYELSWQWLKGKELRLVLTQVQPGEAFLDPVPITIHTRDGKQEVVVTPSGKSFIKTIQLTEQPVRIDIDPGNTLLKEAKVG
jgi:aminopeptidase N